jgi:hypothetical protein
MVDTTARFTDECMQHVSKDMDDGLEIYFDWNSSDAGMNDNVSLS